MLSPRGVLRTALYGALALLFTRTYADADLWGHVRFGLDILGSHALTAVDPYSFTSDVRWVNHEWLAEIAIASAYRIGGNAGLVLLKLLVVGIVVVALHRTVRGCGYRGRTRDILMTLGLLATFFRLQFVRPQLFSIACFAVLLTIVRAHERGSRRAVWLLPPLFVVWVNCHGGWIVGLGVAALWAGFVAASAAGRTRWAAILAVAGAAVATLVNPYGVGMWSFLWRTVGLSRPEIADWNPLWTFPPAILMLELMFPLVVATSLMRARQRQPVSHLVIAGVLGVLMLRVSRIDVFFQLSVALLLLPNAFGGEAVKADVAEERPRRWRALYAAVVALLVIGFATAVVRNVGRVLIVDTLLPDPGALVYVRDHADARRVLTWFNWGEYALWHLSPRRIRVSMDGRRETVYSDRVIEDHFKFYRADPNLRDYPDRIRADTVWLPAHFPVVPKLLQGGWTAAYRSDASVVLVRLGAREPSPSHVPTWPAPRVFPGP